MPTQEQPEARLKISQLVQKFESERNIQQSEADVRAGYIDLLFDALGWNVYNDPGQLTNYRREGYVRGAGYVDVGLEIRGQPVLFLEAKRFGRIPASSERTGDRTTEEKQAFRYARGKKISYAILTNFERLHVFNADHERLILAFDHPRQYLDRLEDLWRLSPEQVEGGSLPWWEGQLEKKDIDLQFLAALRRWRLLLANAIYQHNADNPALQTDGAFDFDALMAAVQRILDRLILVRYGDDKEVLRAHDLLEAMLVEYRNRGAYARPDHLMRAFTDLSNMMDEHHNTTLFAPGHVCERVSVPNQVLAEVISEMNAISFRKFTSDILGSTYESYLGTKLTLRNGAIQDEERRDVRKGRGIYYTPRWVVEYIVDNTLGKRLQEIEKQHGLHAIEKVRGLAVLDPACGSGSFLIYAYQLLADFYRRLNQAIAHEQARLLAEAAQFRLFETLQEIQHLPQPVADYPHVILREHLYGVDLDPEAAEIAAVSLTMQVFADSRREKLPLILNENIKVGNSLISGSEAELRPYFGSAWHDKHPFDWQHEFPQIMARGGFDIIIGNPPYVTSALVSPPEREYHRANFRTATGKYDLYMLFIERVLALAKDGDVSLIVPNKFMHTSAGGALRNLLSRDNSVLEIVNFDDNPVFAHVTNYPCVIVVKRQPPIARHRMHYVDARHPSPEHWESSAVHNNSLGDRAWTLSGRPSMELVDGLARRHPPLEDFASRIATGIQTGADKILLVARSRLDKLELDLFRQILRGRDVKRYAPLTPTQHVFYPFHVGAGGARARIVTEDELSAFPAALAYIREHEQALRKRVWYGKSAEELTGAWYGLMYLGDPLWYAKPKLITPALSKVCNFTMDETGLLFVTGTAGAYGLTLKQPLDDMDSYLYALGLLNSAVTRFCITLMSPLFSGGFYKFNTQYLKRLPFPSPAKSTATSSRLATLVHRILDLHQRLAAKGDLPDSEREQIEREIDHTDREIDDLVYDLYGLTAEERALIEAEVKR